MLSRISPGLSQTLPMLGSWPDITKEKLHSSQSSGLPYRQGGALLIRRAHYAGWERRRSATTIEAQHNGASIPCSSAWSGNVLSLLRDHDYRQKMGCGPIDTIEQ